MSKISITYKKLSKLNNFENIKNAKELSNYKFWHYTSIKNANKIINNKFFKINNFDSFNDQNELREKKEPSRMYAMCFCNSETENIPLWYLYSGISGNGVSIGVTPRNMKNFMRDLDVYIYEDNKVIDKMKKLDRKDFNVECGFIYYKQNKTKNKQSAEVFYKNKWYLVKNFIDKNDFTKEYPWNYEKEFRIVIELNNGIKANSLAVKLSEDFINEFRIKYAPENHTELERNSFKVKPKNSNLSIRMNLISRERDEIINYIKSKCHDEDKLTSEFIINKLKEYFNS